MGTITDKWDAQPDHIEPGVLGFRPIYGARIGDAKVGDIVVDSVGRYGIAEFLEATLTKRHLITDDGEEIYVGFLAPIYLFREQTESTLAESI